MRLLITIVTIAGIIFTGLIIFSIHVLGDQYCIIEIQNNSQQPLLLKTVKYYPYKKELRVDTVLLARNEKIKIGHCINCSTPDTLDIDFDMLGFYTTTGDYQMMHKAALIHYLETMAKEDCITYLVR